MPQPSRHPIATIVTGAVGVILGAALTFCIQVYSQHVADKRVAREQRAKHLERMMVATTNIQISATSFIFKVFDLRGEAAQRERHEFRELAAGLVVTY
jgi:hypothetical protein